MDGTKRAAITVGQMMAGTSGTTEHQDIIPPALVAELRAHLDAYDHDRTTAHRRITEAVDLAQLVTGLEARDRSARHFSRLIHVAEGASLALDLGANAAWDAAVAQ